MLSAATRTRLATPLRGSAKLAPPSAIAPSALPARASLLRSRGLAALSSSSPASPRRPPPARAMSHLAESSARPQPDAVLSDIADYVHSYDVSSALAYETARLCLIDTIGCGLEGLRFPECASLMGPVVDGTVVPNGASFPLRCMGLASVRADGGVQARRSRARTSSSIPSAVRYLPQKLHVLCS